MFSSASARASQLVGLRLFYAFAPKFGYSRSSLLTFSVRSTVADCGGGSLAMSAAL